MTANGLIVAFVVAVWLAYFVPLVLRRYDEATTSATLEEGSGRGRVIHRTPEAEEPPVSTDVDSPIDSPLDTMPATSLDSPSSDVDASAVAFPVSSSRQPSRRPTRAAARLAAQRRRRTLFTLVGFLAFMSGLVGFGPVPVVWLSVPAGLIVAWLVACRLQVRSEYGIGRPVSEVIKRPSMAARKREVIRSADDEDTIIVSSPHEDVDPARRHVVEDTPMPVDAFDEKLMIAVPSVTTAGEAVWDPLPVTVPTYVTKPRVGRTVRTIDFTMPGTWTSGHVEAESVELPGRDEAVDRAAVEAPRRAAGE